MKYFVIILAAFPAIAFAADVPKTYVLSAEQAAIVATWATEKKAAAQQVYTQADSVLSELQKQTEQPKSDVKK